MEVTVAEMPEAAPRTNPLLVEAKYPAQYLGGTLFAQCITSFSDPVVKIILHDRRSGQRKLITAVLDVNAPLVIIGNPEIKENAKKEISKVERPAPQIVRVEMPSPAPNHVLKSPPAVPQVAPCMKVAAPPPLKLSVPVTSPKPALSINKPALKLSAPKLK